MIIQIIKDLNETFREWLRWKEEDNKLNELKEENARVWHIFESFDSHFEIQKIYRNESVNITFYNFKIRNFNYRIFIEQRELSRKKKGSNNYKKQNLKLAKLHRKVQNQRQYRNHSISKKLIDIYDFIGLESLSVLQMMSKDNKNFKGLRNAISNASWFDFCSKLKYKMAESQGLLIQIDRYFPSTKLCFNCGKTRDIDLSERIYTCKCGYQEDRDINTAKNILLEAKKLASS